jgi:DSF synthase
MEYATRCINCIYARVHHYAVPDLITVSLVQGDALGGGFEAALVSDVIIAEEQARFGFPEIRFNSFPGMGAYSLLARKVGGRIAERMMLSGKRYSASTLHVWGVVDHVFSRSIIRS